MTQTFSKASRLGLAGLTLISLTACSMFGSNQSGSTTRAAAPPPPTAAAPTAPVAQVTIRDVQTALQRDGYYKSGTVDGIWGRNTERAVRRFQHDHQIAANGKLDVPTLQALNLTGAPPSTAPENNPSPGTTPGTGNAGNTPATNDMTTGHPPANTPPAGGGTSGTNTTQ